MVCFTGYTQIVVAELSLHALRDTGDPPKKWSPWPRMVAADWLAATLVAEELDTMAKRS